VDLVALVELVRQGLGSRSAPRFQRWMCSGAPPRDSTTIATPTAHFAPAARDQF